MTLSFLVYFKGEVEKKETYPHTRKPVKEKTKKVKLPEESGSKIAIIIDDLGYDYKLSQDLLSIDAPLAFAILPFTPFAVSIARDAHARGKIVMLHLPMEPKDNSRTDMDNSFILTTMDKPEINRRIDECLKSFPYISGVNNHMGSKFTEDAPSMKILLNNIKKRKLFFLDSRTTPDTVAFSLAKEMGIKTAKKSLFLDNDKDIDTIKTKINELLEISITDGLGVGIGHPHQVTIRVLKEMIPQLKHRGVKIVPITELLE